MVKLTTPVSYGHRRLPWQTIGSATDNAVSADEALKIAGLDWTVEAAPTFAFHNGEYVLVDGMTTNLKTNNGSDPMPLGIVGSRYKIFQNQEMFSVLDTVTKGGEARYTAAGELGGGKVVYMVMELPNHVNIPGDPHQAYLLARTSHDGSSALEITTVVNRLFCTNQISGLFRMRRKEDATYTLRHTTNASVDAEQLRAALKISYDEIKLYELFANKTVNISWSDQKFEHYISKVFPMPEGVTVNMKDDLLSRGQKIARSRALNLREHATDSWLNKTQTMSNITGSAFGAFQAVIETYDHLAVTDVEKRAHATIMTNDARKKLRAMELLGV